jgi:hypothetical protein
LLAVLGIGAGYALALAGGPADPGGTPVVEAIGRGGPDALIGVGLIALTVTPLAALAAAALVLARAGERGPAAMAAFVALLLGGSLLLAAVLGPTI